MRHGSPQEFPIGSKSMPLLISDDLRRLNRSKVMRRLFQDGVVSRTTLAAATGLTGAAVSRIVEELIAHGLVEEASRQPERAVRGRPQIGLSLRSDGAFVVGIGIGAFEQAIQIVNQRGECVARSALAAFRSTPASGWIRRTAGALAALVKEAGIRESQIVGLVAAVAGVVDPVRGIVVESPNIGWRAVPAAALLAAATRVPVQIESMHHVLNLAESAQSPQPQIADSVLVNVALGIGASVLEDGRIVRGKHGAAGQIGHLRVVDEGELCTCGRRGCLDTVASGFAVLRRLDLTPARRIARENGARDAGLLRAAIEAERRGDADAKLAFRRCGEQLGKVLEAIRACSDPERIWLAGPVCEAHSFVAGVRSAFADHTPDADGTASIAFSTKSNDGAAAILALDRFVLGPNLDLAQLQR